MNLSAKDIRALIKSCQTQVETAYKGKLDADEYFKRGFLLATKEISDLMVNVLMQYEVKPWNGCHCFEDDCPADGKPYETL